MKVNNQIITCQKYPLAFQGKDKENNSHLVRNTVIIGSIGAAYPLFEVIVNGDNIKEKAITQAEQVIKEGKFNKKQADIYMGIVNSKKRIAAISMLMYGGTASLIYLGYRGIKHLVSGNNSN